jgi:pSer/pThr/pTyr-binding forkhead associated (FHA) protein
VNALGRFCENDLVLTPNHISRRHCLILVHATGGCELSDTASRNGTWVNCDRATRADLLPGDLVAVCDQRFVLTWVGPDGQMLPAPDASDTDLGGPSLPGF